MIKLIREYFRGSNKNTEPQVVRLEVSEAMIRSKIMDGDRDFRMRVTESAEVSAVCKTCSTPMFLAQDEMLVWLHCKGCGRYSFNPKGNVLRDASFALKDGRPLEYEGYFIDFPKELVPPSDFDSLSSVVSSANTD